MKSRVHPKYKTKYRVKNWASYDRGKRGWRKLHLGVDGSGVIVAQVLTDVNADDAATVPDFLGQFEGELSGFVADAAYDSRAVYSFSQANESSWCACAITSPVCSD